MCYNKTMKKKQSSRSSSSSSSKTRVRIDFKPNTVIYEKTSTNKNITNTVQLDVQPQNMNAPTIESETNLKDEENQ